MYKRTSTNGLKWIIRIWLRSAMKKNLKLIKTKACISADLIF